MFERAQQEVSAAFIQNSVSRSEPFLNNKKKHLPQEKLVFLFFFYILKEFDNLNGRGWKIRKIDLVWKIYIFFFLKCLVARCHSFLFIFYINRADIQCFIYTTRRAPLLLSSLLSAR
jgi:hypothetical protein